MKSRTPTFALSAGSTIKVINAPGAKNTRRSFAKLSGELLQLSNVVVRSANGEQQTVNDNCQICGELAMAHVVSRGGNYWFCWECYDLIDFYSEMAEDYTGSFFIL